MIERVEDGVWARELETCNLAAVGLDWGGGGTAAGRQESCLRLWEAGKAWEDTVYMS